MKNVYSIGLSIIFSAFINLPVYAEGIPELKECKSIVLRSSEGWWLMINNDESGSYGYGVQPDRVQVKRDTFDFKQIYTKTRKVATEKRKNAEGPYIAVSYYISGSSSAREYYLSQSRQFLANLFLKARDNALSPSNEIDKRSHDRIEAFWKSNPYISSK